MSAAESAGATSLSWRTSLAILQLGGSVVQPADGCLVVRTPENPGYRWGNCLVVTSGDVDDADGWLSVFAREFPEARYRAIGLPRAPSPGVWEGRGLSVEPERTLTTRVPIAASPLPDGYTVVPVRGDAWSGVLAVTCADGPDKPTFRDFARRRTDSERGLVEAGQAEWFAALGPDGAVVSSLGIVALGPVARFQSVVTVDAHRRRGLARHLLGVASRWAFDRGAGELVIVADEGQAGDRLYRRAGFVPGRIEYSVGAAVWPVPA